MFLTRFQSETWEPGYFSHADLFIPAFMHLSTNCMHIPLSKLEIKGNFLNLMKRIPKTLIADTVLMLKDDCFPPVLRNKTPMLSLLLFGKCTRGPYQGSMSRQIIKTPTDWKGRNKSVSIYRRDDCLCRKFQIIYKNSTRAEKCI